MSLRDELRRALDALTLFSAGSERLSVQEGPVGVACELAELDRLACAFSRLQVTSPKLQAASLDELKVISQALSEKLTYLLEPVRPIEVDEDRVVVQMRSVPPQQDEGQTAYYELLVERSGLELCRYTKAPGEPRVRAAAHVTREVLLRLAGDLVAAA